MARLACIFDVPSLAFGWNVIPARGQHKAWAHVGTVGCGPQLGHGSDRGASTRLMRRHGRMSVRLVLAPWCVRHTLHTASGAHMAATHTVSVSACPGVRYSCALPRGGSACLISHRLYGDR